MSAHDRRISRSRIWGAAAVVLLVCGVAAIVYAVRAQQSAPQPPASAAESIAVTPSSSSRMTPSPSDTPSSGMTSSGMTSSNDSSENADQSSPSLGAGSSTSTPAETTAAPTTTEQTPSTTTSVAPPTESSSGTHGPILQRSLPVHLSIPAIHVSKNLKKIGLTKDDHIKTPPLVKDSHPFWLTVSPTPGQLGPSVILGHVDSAKWGPAIFFELGKLRQHDKISVTLADHTVAVFEVTHVNEYKKAHFPTQAVYGNIDHAGLRLMTCGGTFNHAKRSYESDIVVYAALVSSHHA